MKWNEEIEKIWCYMIAQQNEISEMPLNRTDSALECTKEIDEPLLPTNNRKSLKRKKGPKALIHGR